LDSWKQDAALEDRIATFKSQSKKEARLKARRPFAAALHLNLGQGKVADRGGNGKPENHTAKTARLKGGRYEGNSNANGKELRPRAPRRPCK
jgi:hypothetical protein